MPDFSVLGISHVTSVSRFTFMAVASRIIPFPFGWVYHQHRMKQRSRIMSDVQYHVGMPSPVLLSDFIQMSGDRLDVGS